MLNKTITYDDGNPRSWGLTFPIDSDWNDKKRRVLIIQQSVDGRDIKAGGLLKDLGVRTAFVESIKYARGIARQYDPKFKDFAVGAVNFQAWKHLHLKGHARSEAESEFRTRMHKIIKKLNPTHILFSGDLNVLYPMQNAPLKNGWVHKIDDRFVTSTLDWARLLEKQGQYANLLGFWCRHLANLLTGVLPHSISDLAAKPVYVNTMAKFKHMMTEYDRCSEFGLDTETRNLTVSKNAIYTMQMAFDHSPTVGYVLPIDHPHADNPFSPEERKIIKRQLRRRFGDSESKRTMITFNGIYDLRVIRRALDLDIIYMPCWEIMAGEHDLDENISSMNGLGIKSGGLAAVLTSYGNDFYIRGTSSFSKEDRNTVGSISPGDKDFLEYGAMDVVGPLALKAKQIERSAYQTIAGRVYTPYFKAHVLHQMSDTVHQLSHLKDAGSLINKRYLRSLMRPDSVLAQAIKDLGDEFKTFPEVRETNKVLLDQAGFKAKSLWSFGAKAAADKSKDGETDSVFGQWMFSFNKSAHKVKLFIENLGLEPVNISEKTGIPSIDKEFIATYKDRSFLVAKYGEYQAATKLMSTYVRGWYKALSRTIDGIYDSHLRSSYTFFNVDTGRLASKDPNLQNIPARGKLSKIIKEMFIAPDGCLLIRFDYSAHEVRGWSIVSGDIPLAEAFRTGQRLRQEFIKAHPPTLMKFPLSDEDYAKASKAAKTTSDLVKRLKREGDLHIVNVFKFFGKWVEKSDPLRDAIKKVVFGTLYGKSAQTLGHDTKEAEFTALKDKMGVAYKAGDKAALAKLELQYKKLMDDDRTDYAQGIIDKMFASFKAGKKWIERMARLAEEHQHVYSPIGRIRHLYATLTKDKQIISRQVRRGMNAPIQGFASEIAVKASRLVMMSYYTNQARLKRLIGLDPDAKFGIKFNRIVHDASYFTVPYEMVIPFLHMLQYDMTYGITKAYESEFGFKFTVEPEIEMEIGVKDTESRKWGWALPELLDFLDKAVDDGLRDKFLTGNKREIMGRILAPWKNEESLDFLNTKWPLLNVDLKPEIQAAVAAYEALAKAQRIAAKKAKTEKKEEVAA